METRGIKGVARRDRARRGPSGTEAIGPTAPLRSRYVTLKVAVATWPPTSVAVTVDVVVPLGTTKVQLNAPTVFVVSEPFVQWVIFTPSKFRDDSAVETENPVPETVTVAPCAPEEGEIVIFGVVTVNVPDAESWGDDPRSVAVTVVPEVPLGTGNVQLNVTAPRVVNEPELQRVMGTPRNDSVTAFDTVNPVPPTVTVAPTGPWVGVTLIFGVVTVNVPYAL
jgi:hypothetical protein